MPIAILLLNITVVFWLVCSLVTACVGNNNHHFYKCLALFLGGVTMLAAAGLGWLGNYTWDAPFPMYLGVAPLSNHLDSLASIFIGLLAIITIAIALFSPGYLQHLDRRAHWGAYWVQLFLFLIGMLGLILSANAISFLVSWEIVALTSLFLIATNLANREARRAAFIYLGTTRIATTLLITGFLWAHTIFHSWTFSDWYFSEQVALIPAAIILLGLCIKAGIWPFHSWLPYAHPAAPAPISALMSGVMIELSLYAIIRILVMNGLKSPYIAYTLLVLGLGSAFWGILCALMQNDLKRLLAYSSIENIGLAMIGISLVLIGQDLHLPMVAGICLAAAILHCVNHGLFKSLLFLGAGTLDSRVHTRDLEFLGGLGKRMPSTMLLFVLGSAAICAIPPLNGFNSKWLIYQGLFQLVCNADSLWIGGAGIACIAILALVSGMSLYCFTKVIGVAFLGRARSQSAEMANEANIDMLIAQASLAFGCIFLGVSMLPSMMAIQPICNVMFNNSVDLTTIYILPMSVFALVLMALTGFFYKYLLTVNKQEIKRFITWECGFGDLTGRMQGSALSFTENVAHSFAPLLQWRLQSIISGRDRRHFPETISTEVRMTSLLESRIYGPPIRFVRWLGEHVLLLQAGSVHLYLGYILLTLVALMVIGVLI